MTRGRALGSGNLRKLAGVWVLDWTDEFGKRRRKRLGSNQRTAEQIRGEIIRRRDLARAGLENVAGQELRLRQIRDDYVADLALRVSPAHLRNVRSFLDRTIEALCDATVGDLRAMDVLRYRNQLQAQGLSNRTANLHADSLRGMLNWAAEIGLITANPIKGLRRLPEGKDHQRNRRRALSDKEIERYLAAVAFDDEQCDIIALDVRIPQLPLFETLLSTGGRWNEVRLLAWGDLDLDARVVVFRSANTKSRKQRAIPIQTELAEVLRDLKVLHEAVLRRLPTVRDRVFLTPEGKHWAKHTANAMRIHDRVLRRARIPKVDVEGRKVDVHALRHTYATRLARADVSLVKAQRLLGHASASTTSEIYTHIGIEDLRDAVNSIARHPQEHGLRDPSPRKDQAQQNQTG